MLGLGDIVMPGLLLCFVMRYDAYKRAQVRFTRNLEKIEIRDILVYKIKKIHKIR